MTFSPDKFSTGTFNIDNGDGSITSVDRFTYEDGQHSYDVIKRANTLFCSYDSGYWQEFTNTMHGSSSFAAVILYFNLEA